MICWNYFFNFPIKISCNLKYKLCNWFFPYRSCFHLVVEDGLGRGQEGKAPAVCSQEDLEHRGNCESPKSKVGRTERTWMHIYGNMGCWVFKWGDTKLERFLAIPKENYWILRIGVMIGVKNWASFDKIKIFQNWCYKKMLIFFIKKMKKIPMICDVENWLWKSNLGTFWHLPMTSIFKFQLFPMKKSFQFCNPRLKTQQPVLP